MRKIDGKIVAFFSFVVYYFGDLLKSAIRALVQSKNSLVCNLINCHYYCTVHNEETVTEKEILKSYVACLLTSKFMYVTASFF